MLIKVEKEGCRGVGEPAERSLFETDEEALLVGFEEGFDPLLGYEGSGCGVSTSSYKDDDYNELYNKTRDHKNNSINNFCVFNLSMKMRRPAYNFFDMENQRHEMKKVQVAAEDPENPEEVQLLPSSSSSASTSTTCKCNSIIRMKRLLDCFIRPRKRELRDHASSSPPTLVEHVHFLHSDLEAASCSDETASCSNVAEGSASASRSCCEQKGTESRRIHRRAIFGHWLLDVAVISLLLCGFVGPVFLIWNILGGGSRSTIRKAKMQGAFFDNAFLEKMSRSISFVYLVGSNDGKPASSPTYGRRRSIQLPAHAASAGAGRDPPKSPPGGSATSGKQVAGESDPSGAKPTGTGRGTKMKRAGARGQGQGRAATGPHSAINLPSAPGSAHGQSREGTSTPPMARPDSDAEDRGTGDGDVPVLDSEGPAAEPEKEPKKEDGGFFGGSWNLVIIATLCATCVVSLLGLILVSCCSCGGAAEADELDSEFHLSTPTSQLKRKGGSSKGHPDTPRVPPALGGGKIPADAGYDDSSSQGSNSRSPSRGSSPASGSKTSSKTSPVVPNIMDIPLPRRNTRSRSSDLDGSVSYGVPVPSTNSPSVPDFLKNDNLDGETGGSFNIRIPDPKRTAKTPKSGRRQLSGIGSGRFSPTSKQGAKNAKGNTKGNKRSRSASTARGQNEEETEEGDLGFVSTRQGRQRSSVGAGGSPEDIETPTRGRPQQPKFKAAATKAKAGKRSASANAAKNKKSKK
ncbi:unnamed protein product [Amoebophrya sp. A25]|nr:unnamed protein product [Amoebophrya sp. A25]|eukprot:GSA25T00002677001.1